MTMAFSISSLSSDDERGIVLGVALRPQLADQGDGGMLAANR